MKYISKVIEVDAIQFTKDNFKEVKEFTNEHASNFRASRDGAYCYLNSNSDVRIVDEGEYIEKLDEDTFKIHCETLFKMQYEPVKHGKWEFHRIDGGREFIICPYCKYHAVNFSNYCSNCGAKLDGYDLIEEENK